ncbi:MAG: SLBB domain-containing protein [Planctomycetes bacterium]|nr:SLBB domain-containing protein [Planctomycetota bacterium]
MDERQRAQVLGALQGAGGLTEDVAALVGTQTGVPEAEVYGAGSFFHLLDDTAVKLRMCTGLSCAMKGSRELLTAAQAAGLPAAECSCLAACDLAPAALREREVLPEFGSAELDAAGGDWHAVRPEQAAWCGAVDALPGELAMDLAGERDRSGDAFARAAELGAGAVIAEVDAAGLQGRGGAGFPAAFKWKAVRRETAETRYVVLNADEGEPGAFKDREVLLRRPDLVVEGLAIAAAAVGAREVWCYLGAESGGPWRSLPAEIDAAKGAGLYDGIAFHLHAAPGAYICGEETALLEALEGKRGMPRLKPPFPTQVGLWGRPTLIHNVETIACVPAIVRNSGAWFAGLGRTGPGTKLYCLSGHVARPGVYEAPLGVSLDELLEAAGGVVGELKAFSPGGASSGFLPASESGRPLDFKSLAEVGSMLGSAGIVVLNDAVNMAEAALIQLRFFEAESCGQCAPCRIGTRFLREALEEAQRPGDGEARRAALRHVADAAWQMNEGSICGLGQAAPLPLTSALKWFPEDFEA